MIEERLVQARARVAAAAPDRADDVDVMAVTKGFGPEAVEAAAAAGLVWVGESYWPEAEPKAALAQRLGLQMAFVGRLQSNKAAKVAAAVDRIDSVDRPSLIDRLARLDTTPPILVQMNLSGEAGKGGCDPADVDELVERAQTAGLAVEGLMGVGSAGDPAATAAGFAQLVAAADRLDLAVRSIGMTGDLELAVAAGSTQVRLGEALFGPRPR